MRVRDHRRTQPNRTAAAASTCCPISAVAGVRGATTFAQTRLRRCLPGRNRRGGYGAGAMRNHRQDGRGPSSCSRLPSSDLGAPGRRRADRRKGTTGRPARTDRVSFCAHTAGGHTEALFFLKYGSTRDALLGCSKSEHGRLGKLQGAAHCCEGDMGVP